MESNSDFQNIEDVKSKHWHVQFRSLFKYTLDFIDGFSRFPYFNTVTY